ncbi:MAG: hypothetical protein ACFE7E_01410 [Candidatus Hodarchaeota archaeon]
MTVRMEEQEQVHKKKNPVSSGLLYEEYTPSKDDSRLGQSYLHGCPCLICKEIKACGTGQEISPILCPELGIWAQELAKRKK